MSKPLSEVCRVASVSQDRIDVEVLNSVEFKNLTNRVLSIGSYLRIADEDDHSVIAVVQAYRIKDPTGLNGQEVPNNPVFVIEAQPVGFITAGREFRRGGQHIAIPPTKVSIATAADLKAVYSIKSKTPLVLGTLARETEIDVPLNGDVFFSKHVAVVGSTGCGKSCTVAKILQEGIAASIDQAKRGVLNNSHIIVFDLHGEYAAAFPERSRTLNVDNLKLPYWLLNAEELEEIFIMSDEMNSHNQVSQFRHAVLMNKRRHNQDLTRISYDSPVHFNLEEVYNYLLNMNNEVIGKRGDENCPVLAPQGDSKERAKIRHREESYFSERLTFAEASQAKDDKATKGPFSGEFDRFILRLRTVLDDPRMSFLLNPKKDDTGEPFKTNDLKGLISTLIGYADKSERNITIVDLSGIPFEVMSLVVSLMSRLIFEVGFHLKKRGITKKASEIPLLAVYEEAHIYAPNSQLAKYRSVTKSIERIAKEGRKYGISLMIVSQRPSEISETIFSQCNNIVAMRLTNPTDQNYVKRMLPDSVVALTDTLPVLEQREALLIGDALSIPAIIRTGELKDRPKSDDVEVLTEWKGDWRQLAFGEVLDGMTKQ